VAIPLGPAFLEDFEVGYYNLYVEVHSREIIACQRELAQLNHAARTTGFRKLDAGPYLPRPVARVGQLIFNHCWLKFYRAAV